MRRLLVLLLFVGFFSACSHEWSKDELVGKYVLDSKASGFVLELKNDGTYVHSHTTSEGQTMFRSGKWELDNSDPDNPVCLDNFSIFDGEPIGKSDVPSIFILHPASTWSGVRFPVGDPDAPSHYFVLSESPH